MDSIDADDLYEERGIVAFSRPILQGDIFADVTLPDFDDVPRRVQIVAHPCSMRRGVNLNERIQVAPVEKYVEVDDWNGHLRVMPLPDLLADGNWYASMFVDLTSVKSTVLSVERRVASLSQRGILTLQQRIVKHYTRLEVHLQDLRQQSAPVLAEAEMQETWVDTVLDGHVPSAETVDAAVAHFQAWLSEDDNRRRKALESEINHADLRREVKAAAESQIG